MGVKRCVNVVVSWLSSECVLFEDTATTVIDSRSLHDGLPVYVGLYLGSLLVELGGADVIVFTGGIGENQPQVRATVCQDLEELGVQLDENANAAADGESCISDEGSRTQVWVIPTNEELIVARQVCQLLEG